MYIHKNSFSRGYEMKNSRENYTERQIAIIENIGRRKRPSLKKEKRKNTILSIVFYCVCLSFLIFLSIDDNRYLFTTLFLSVFGTIVFFANIAMYFNRLDNLNRSDDFQVGLHYMHNDVHIIGNNKKLLKNNIFVSLSLFILSFIFAIIMSLAFYGNENPDYSEMLVFTKEIESMEMQKDDLFIHFRDDSHKYFVNSIFSDYIDYNQLFEEVIIGDELTVYTENYNQGTDRSISIYYLEHEGIVYLGYDNMIQGYEANVRVAFVTFIVSTLLAILILVWMIIYKYCIYDNNVVKEEYELRLSKLEIKDLLEKRSTVITDSHDLYIEIKQPKRNLIIASTIAFVLSIISIIIYLYAQGTTNRNIGTIFMGTIAALFWFALLTVYKDKEIISNNTFIKKRVFRTRKVDFKDIKLVKIALNSIEIIGKDNNTILTASFQSKNIKPVIDAFENNNIYVDKL